MDKPEGFQCLRHSNWTTCSPLSTFCYDNFQFASPLYWEANSYYPRGLIVRKGNSSHSKNGYDRGISVLGTFKLDHLQPLKPILFWQFSICNTFVVLGGQFLLPQRANCEKREFSQLQKWMRQRCLSTWGIQIGLFAAPSAHCVFVLTIFHLLHFYFRMPVLITQEG